MSSGSRKNSKTGANATTTRKTLMQLQAETTVRDPAAHAKNQITELDKTAKRSLDKRSKCTLQLEEDSKSLGQIEEQIQRIKLRYDCFFLFIVYMIIKYKIGIPIY